MPAWFKRQLCAPSYQQDKFVDTADLFGCGEWKYYIKLSRLCGALGIAVKTSPCSGADFYKWWGGQPEHHQTSKDYCMEDVWATRAAFHGLTGRPLPQTVLGTEEAPAAACEAGEGEDPDALPM